ncbi:Periplasmic protease [Ignavibacterium album JCM 16511]|uniref:Periplasmic protease n=1 Tax=Ignavibacterium album (strain DSM 19864 / JCM 16511 / NBRC 101810 / Mat9-16) TaxID=945713 RepID=I0AJW3_IGNAJ|nr:S41 family peptidase [Ignavibacterium album]AFH49270.1 Periplasmic protease [Ignavibacterium album JCM 16511]
MFSNWTKFPFLFLVLTIGALIGIQLEKVFSGDNLRESIRKFNDVLTYTEKYYIEEVDTQKLVEAALNGMFNQLDPHSVYIPAKEFTAVEESFRGDFEGIGIEFQIVNDTLTVVSPITGGPSEQLGILPGDRIVKIDGNPVIGITNDDVRQKLRGKAGTKVNVTIARPGVSKLLEYTIVRDKIPIYSVDAHFMIDDKTGYVSVSRFSETTFDELFTALKDLDAKGMKQLLLDLRGNPGGYLNQAVQIADLFIDGQKRIVYTEGRRKEFNEEYYASETYPYEKIPLVVLINRGSASASEIVSGAIQDWDRGLVVGETSFGKGLVQRQFQLFDNSAIRLTISEYFTPSGRLIQRDYKNKKDKKDYYSEISDREESEGENIEHTAEKDSTKPTYKTLVKKRTVFGGGGITPDYIVKSETLTEYTQNLLKENLFYSFVLNYLDTKTKDIKNRFGDNLNKFRKEFFISDEMLNSFVSYAKTKKVEFVKSDFEKDKDYIAARLKAQIARNFWKNDGWYSVLLEGDSQYNQALKLFNEAKDLANLK